LHFVPAKIEESDTQAEAKILSQEGKARGTSFKKGGSFDASFFSALFIKNLQQRGSCLSS